MCWWATDVYKRQIQNVLDQRQKTIEADIAAAQTSKTEAAAALTTCLLYTSIEDCEPEVKKLQEEYGFEYTVEFVQ